MIEEILTTRLKMRPIKLEDAITLNYEIDKDLTKYWIGWEPSNNVGELREKIKSSIEKSRRGLNLDLSAFERKSNQFIGCCGISKTDFKDYEINVWVRHSSQNKGYAKEMVRAIIKWTKENTELSYLIYSVTQGNKASEHIAQELQAVPFRTWDAKKRGKNLTVQDYKVII